MIIKSLSVKNFRCFSDDHFAFNDRVSVIQGPNGSGKSSLLEALHYCCYLTSFRTNAHHDLIQMGKDHFFIALEVFQESLGVVDTIHVGFSDHEGKVVTRNNKPVRSYKELVAQFKVVTLTADDIRLVSGAPEERRDFLNYALVLQDAAHWTNLKQYRSILDQRNQLLMVGTALSDEFEAWTQQLWEQACEVRNQRKRYLASLEHQINALLAQHFSDRVYQGLAVHFEYQARGGEHADFKAFWREFQATVERERAWKRTLFGPHLDDFFIIFHQHKARVYASRGQQKLVALLIKVAQLLQLSEEGEQGVLLLDDFMTDFDTQHVERCFAVLCTLKMQIVVSTPLQSDLFCDQRTVGTVQLST